MRKVIPTALLIAFASAASYALDGIAVSTSFYASGAIAPANCPIVLPGWLLRPAGVLVKYTVAGSRVNRCDTLVSYDKGMVQFPAMNLEGTKVAFFLINMRCTRNAQGTPVYPAAHAGHYGNLFWADTTWLSVADINGGNLTNLVQLEVLNTEEGEEYAGLDWPAGDWVYYEKPTKSHEIWRVNVLDKRNELVVKFKGDDENPNDFYIRRFGLSIDCRYLGIQTLGYTVFEFYNNIASCFPPAQGDLTSCLPRDGGSNGCNMAISSSGRYFSHYLYSGHQHCYVRYWDGTPAGNINATDVGVNTKAGAEHMRYSVNSDRVLLQWIARNGATGSGGWSCADVYCVNTVSGEYFALSSNPNGWSSDAGDFRVACAPENVGKYETREGVWTAISPVFPPAIPVDNPGVVAIPPDMTPGLTYTSGSRSGVTRELTLDVRGNWSSGATYTGFIKIDRPYELTVLSTGGRIVARRSATASHSHELMLGDAAASGFCILRLTTCDRSWRQPVLLTGL